MARRSKKLGLLLLAIYLILTGLVHLVHLHFAGLDAVRGLLALLAGILMVVDR